MENEFALNCKRDFIINGLSFVLILF